MRNSKIVLLVLLLHVLVIGTYYVHTANAEMRSIKGLFELVWGGEGKLPITNGLKFEYIDGITLYVPWNEVEPEEGKYRWQVIDEALSRAQAANKILNIGIFPNFRSPKFVYDAGAATFEYTKWAQHNDVKAVVKGPVPWDRVYISKWKDFIKALANRFDGKNNVGYVSINGPSLQANEMAVNLKNKDDLARFKAAGFSNETLITAWKEVIDCYEQNFRKTKVALYLGSVQRDTYPAQKISSYAYQKLGNRLVLKIVFLNGKWFQRMKAGQESYKLVELLQSYSSTNDVGMEMFWKSTFRGGEKNGPLDVAIENGINKQARFIEIYRDDIEQDGMPNASHEKILRKYHSRF